MDDPARLRRVFKTRLEDFARAVNIDFGHRPRIETLLADGVPVLNVARIAAGKFLNAGQACIAPDYALVHEAERDAFVALLRAYVTQHYPAPADGGDYASIVDDAQHARLCAWLEEARAAGAQIISLHDGLQDPAQRKFAPTTVLDAPDSLALMREEIFGPVLPVVTYRQFDEAVDYVTARARPLSLCVFDDDQARVARGLEA